MDVLYDSVCEIDFAKAGTRVSTREKLATSTSNFTDAFVDYY